MYRHLTAGAKAIVAAVQDKAASIAAPFVFAVSMFTILVGTGAGARAEGLAKPWQMWLQDPESPSADMIYNLNLFLVIIEAAIVLLVLGLLIVILLRFNRRANPTPSKTTHNTKLEVVWTVIPVLILAVIAVPSLKTLYFADKNPEAEMNLKITGNQWFWSYEYPDQDGLSFDSFILYDDQLKDGQPRMLSVDNPVVLPANTTVRLLINSNDVIHDWAVPSLGIKIDATPGRVNETWVRIEKPGDYYGQCSELCGVNHGFMPIHVKAVPREEFAAWVKKAKEEFASNDDATTDANKTVRLAGAEVAAR
jgi:cytochrome c oxidase subunit 2